ncbi:MAG TPA: hypothetical protein VFZ49_05530 [Pyrinomonadaceae bacterium]
MAVQGKQQATGAASAGQERGMGSPELGKPQSTHEGRTDRGQDLTGQVTEAGRDVASHSMQAASDGARSATESYRQEISSGLHSLADGLRETGGRLRDDGSANSISSAGSHYLETVANKVDDLSGYLERQDLTGLLRDFRGFARRNPTMFVGGAFALGFAISRVVRSGSGSSAHRSYDRARL